MREILRTNNIVELSWAQNVLTEGGIETFLFDQHAAMVDGSINMLEQRLMVADDLYNQAKRLLAAAKVE
jgi:hypothetical protein